MRRWSWYEPAPKQPVPADGLAVDRFGDTWWGKEWIRSLLRLGGSYSNRLPRGRSYARAGRVVDLEIGAGEISAGVVGTRPRPYRVRIGLGTLAPATWARVVEIIAGRARFAAALLRGELPEELASVLYKEGINLFPAGTQELATKCSCPDWANPCKHVAAVHYVVAAALDMDPFLIFVLRGLGREALFAALAEARGAPPPEPVLPLETPGPELESAWETPNDDLDEAGYLGLGTPIPQLAFEIRPSGVDLAGLAVLGPPPPALEAVPQALGPAIRKAAKNAVALARGASAEVTSPPKNDDAIVRKSVLAFLKGRSEGATLLLMCSRLPYSKEELTRVVRQLRRDGTLATQGRGAALRYFVSRLPAEPASESRVPARRPTRGKRRSSRDSRPPVSPKSSSDDRAATLEERILAVLGEARDPLAMREIAERLDTYMDSRLRNAIKHLRAIGTVKMLGNRGGARYTLSRRRRRPRGSKKRRPE